MSQNYRSVGVLGAGAWGTALATVSARAGLDVALWAHEPDVARDMAATRRNDAYLPGVTLDAAIRPTSDLQDIAAADLILAVVPAQHLRPVLQGLGPLVKVGTPVALCAKGVEQGTLKLMSEVLEETIPQSVTAVLSGPSFAGEVARELPTAVTLACADAGIGERLAQAIATPTFRPYVATDVIGAEIGGSVKNVLAIACGIAEGRQMGRSAHAALITRGFAEMTRLAVARGAEAATLTGLCGLGDLVLTCSSPQSRNMSVGLALGRGETLAQAIGGKRSVAEGVASAPAVQALAARLGVETPICAAVAAVLDGRLEVGEAIRGLLARPLRGEGE